MVGTRQLVLAANSGPSIVRENDEYPTLKERHPGRSVKTDPERDGQAAIRPGYRWLLPLACGKYGPSPISIARRRFA